MPRRAYNLFNAAFVSWIADDIFDNENKFLDIFKRRETPDVLISTGGCSDGIRGW